MVTFDTNILQKSQVILVSFSFILCFPPYIKINGKKNNFWKKGRIMPKIKYLVIYYYSENHEPECRNKKS